MHNFAIVVTDCVILGLIYSLVAFGLLVAMRGAAFPDLTLEGSFALGAATSMAFAVQGMNLLGAALGILAGALAGVVSAGVFTVARTGKLISGIIGMVLAQGTALVIMGATANIDPEASLFGPWLGFDRQSTLYLFGEGGQTVYVSRVVVLAGLIAGICWLLAMFAKTTVGMATRSLAKHADILPQLGRSPRLLFVLVLVGANMLAAASGVLFAHHNGGFDASLNFGTILVGLVALLIGEELYRRAGRKFDIEPVWHLAAVVAGSITYCVVVAVVADFVLEVGLAKVNPNLRRLITAMVLAAALFLRRGRHLQTDDI